MANSRDNSKKDIWEARQIAFVESLETTGK